MSESAVLNVWPPVRDMVAGALWLVRDGEIYWETSQEREHVAQYFIDEMAPRVAMGIGAKHELMMLEIDGDEPNDEGMSIPEFAEFCKKLGFVQAVNVDGTSSSSCNVMCRWR